jgi:hypothetical protein
MTETKDLRALAKRLALDCIEDWAHEGQGERMDEWDLSPSEMAEVVRLAQAAEVTIP